MEREPELTERQQECSRTLRALEKAAKQVAVLARDIRSNHWPQFDTDKDLSESRGDCYYWSVLEARALAEDWKREDFPAVEPDLPPGAILGYQPTSGSPRLSHGGVNGLLMPLEKGTP